MLKDNIKLRLFFLNFAVKTFDKRSRRFDLSMINANVQKSKVQDEIRVKEDKPPLVNKQRVVYCLCVTCVMQVMSAILAGTYTNELKYTKHRQLDTT